MTADCCSVSGKRGINCDFAVYEEDVGAVMADAFGNVSIGNAISQYCCITAMDAIRNGAEADQAIQRAFSMSDPLRRFLKQGKYGAAVCALNFKNHKVKVAWAGDVKCFLLCPNSNGKLISTTPHRGAGNAITSGIGISSCQIDSIEFEANDNSRILICSDGVWDEIPEKTIVETLRDAETPSEVTARLVLGRSNDDDATALAIFC